MDTLKMPQYIDLFVQNGYESLQFVKEIKSMDDLEEIGINDIEDQMIIIREIDKLRSIQSDTPSDGSLAI